MPYCDCIDKLLDFGQFDTLAHFDYMLRYATANPAFTHSFSGYEAEVEQLIKKTVNKGILLEINTAKVNMPGGVIGPEPFILRLYKQCGGEAVTLASDAHHTSHLLRGFQDAAQLARNCGIKYAAYFDQRQMKTYPL